MSCRPRNESGRQIVLDQSEALLDACGIPALPATQLIVSLAGDALRGPFIQPRRFSAINTDGFPFQWSVSLGARPASLRFVTECGVPGTTIAERIRFTRDRLRELAPDLGLAAGLPALDQALDTLLPPADLLEAADMGLCVGVEITSPGSVGITIYVNTEIGSTDSRYRRLNACLRVLRRTDGHRRLASLQRAVGTRVVPAFCAIDLLPDGVGRLEVYFRPSDGRCDLLASAARIAVGDDVDVLGDLHQRFLDASSYPHSVVDFSLEFPPDEQSVGFKVDLNLRRLLTSDAQADARILALVAELNLDAAFYEAARDIIVGVPRSGGHRSILFVALALRNRGRDVAVYLHPCPGVKH